MTAKSIIKSILFTLFVPGTIILLVPYLLSKRFDYSINLGILKYIGIIIVILGILFYSMSVFSFITLGGTPQIYFMKKLEHLFGLEPKKLANSGMYTFSRNPMYTGVFLTILGEGIYFESVPTIGWGVIFFLLVNFVVIYIEEPHLKQIHGEEYMKTTPRWIGYKLKKSKVE